MRLLVACIVCVLLALSFPGIVSKLEDNFTKCGDFFFKGESPLIHGILENSEPRNNDYRVVCQKYRDKIRYATLYDTKKKIPVFSAYKYTGTKVFVKQESLQTRMIELEVCIYFFAYFSETCFSFCKPCPLTLITCPRLFSFSLNPKMLKCECHL